MSSIIQAQLLKITKHPSKYGGDFYYLFFKESQSGNSYRSCISPSYRNWRNWSEIVNNFHEDTPITLGNLILRNNLIDADSHPTILD